MGHPEGVRGGGTRRGGRSGGRRVKCSVKQGSSPPLKRAEWFVFGPHGKTKIVKRERGGGGKNLKPEVKNSYFKAGRVTRYLFLFFVPFFCHVFLFTKLMLFVSWSRS